MTKHVAQARKLAETAHAGQEYNDGVPYITHLADVVGVLTDFGYDTEDLIVAAWLHDVVEDTAVTLEDLTSFGPIVVTVVEAVTNSPGANRAERHAQTYPRIRLFQEAIVVKLADRIANMRATKEQGNVRLWKMYQDEYQYFRKMLRAPRHAVPMWTCLDELYNSQLEV